MLYVQTWLFKLSLFLSFSYVYYTDFLSQRIAYTRIGKATACGALIKTRELSDSMPKNNSHDVAYEMLIQNFQMSISFDTHISYIVIISSFHN